MTHSGQEDHSVLHNQKRPRIRVEVKQVRNLGDYNSCAYTYSVENDVPEGHKISEAIDATVKNLEKLLEKKLMEYSQLND